MPSSPELPPAAGGLLMFAISGHSEAKVSQSGRGVTGRRRGPGQSPRPPVQKPTRVRGTCGKCAPEQERPPGTARDTLRAPGEPCAHLRCGHTAQQRGSPKTFFFSSHVFSWVVVLEECGKISGTLAWLFFSKSNLNLVCRRCP